MTEDLGGKIYFENAAQVTLGKLQEAMTGASEVAGFRDEEAVISYIKDLRRAK